MSPRTLLALFILAISPACAPGAARAPSPEPAAAPSTGASVPLRDCPTPPDLGVLLVGRHDGCDPSGARTGWSGSGLLARFSGTALQLRHAGPAVQYTVLIDGGLRPNLLTKPGSGTYPLATGLAEGEHEVALYRRGEASFGAAVLQGLEVVDGELLPPPPPYERRLEVVGDSITCGYGDEGTSTDCRFSADTENHYLTYGAVLGRRFDAEVSTVAWSGKGVVVNYGGAPGPTLPALYEAAVPTDGPSRWGTTWQPQGVIVNLGTNDYSTDADPPDARFVTEYEALLVRLRERYPGAFILCTVGPMLSGSDLATARANIRAAVERRQRAGDEAVVAHELMTPNPDPGCDWHPSARTHEAMASELAEVLAPRLGWTSGPPPNVPR